MILSSAGSIWIYAPIIDYQLNLKELSCSFLFLSYFRSISPKSYSLFSGYVSFRVKTIEVKVWNILLKRFEFVALASGILKLFAQIDDQH